MIRITDTFAVRRIGSLAVAGIVEEYDSAHATLTAAQCRDAAEAFNVMAVMLAPTDDEYPDAGESAADRAYQLAKEAA